MTFTALFNLLLGFLIGTFVPSSVKNWIKSKLYSLYQYIQSKITKQS